MTLRLVEIGGCHNRVTTKPVTTTAGTGATAGATATVWILRVFMGFLKGGRCPKGGVDPKSFNELINFLEGFQDHTTNFT